MYFIFDFDGTLVDSFTCVIDKFNLLASDFNFRKVDLDKISELKDLNSRDLIKYLNIPFFKIPAVLYKARNYLRSEMHKLPPFPGIPRMLENLFNAGFSLGIVTSNSEENVISWLKYHKINQYFNFIHSESSYFGKKRILKKVIKVNKIKNAIYVGDETRDIEAAHMCSLPSIAVTWGFNSEKILLQYNPHYIAHVPEDLLVIGLKYLETKSDN